MKDQSNITNEISKRYLAAREYLRLGQKEIAEMAGLTASAVNYIEKGKQQNPSFQYTDFLVRKGFNYNYLMGRSPDMFSNVVEKTTDLDKLHEKNEVLENKVHDLERMVSILLGELERLKKELSQSRTIPMTDHGYHQLPEVQVGKHETVNNDWGLWKNGNLLKKAI